MAQSGININQKRKAVVHDADEEANAQTLKLNREEFKQQIINELKQIFKEKN